VIELICDAAPGGEGMNHWWMTARGQLRFGRRETNRGWIWALAD